ncbi:hypothetical protein GCM10009712_36890 [Pseudarthrobacter sulfonivorans]|uniref:hypothetical protein n=1 Tax=Pseudarthrobacter sulfonivorans TaxID=121292 RepID=UPI00168A70DD|nr:hypothetical protein [Pseudarthrobacter sulfonivorans]
MQTFVDGAIRIHVTSRRALDEKLEVAVKQLQAVAMRTRTHGILVTRHEPGAYTAALSNQVPFGITMERIC